jgi:hypothetical protein
LSSAAELSRLIDQVAVQPLAERCLLRLQLEGILDAEAMILLQQLREVADRYVFAELDESGLHMQPTEAEIGAIAGEGVLRRVLEQLQEEARAREPPQRCIAERAILLLYQIAHEVGT